MEGYRLKPAAERKTPSKKLAEAVRQEAEVALELAKAAEALGAPPEQLPAALPPMNANKDEVQVQRVKKEIQTTEASYLTSIRSLQAFRKKLQEDPSKPANKFKKSPEGIKLIRELKKIDGIVSTSEILSNAIKDTKDANDFSVVVTSQGIADAFLAINFSYYHSYVESFSVIKELNDSLEEKNKYYASLSKKHFEVEKTNFNACLITPIQRVPRYQLLLEALINGESKLHLSSSKNEVITALNRSFEKVKEEALAINESKRAQEVAEEALSKPYDSEENRALRTTKEKPGNFKLEDLKELQYHLNEGKGEKFTVRFNKKNPLVIECILANSSQVLYKIIQNKDLKTFSVKIEKDLAKLKGEDGKTLDHVAIERELTKAEDVSKACEATINEVALKKRAADLKDRERIQS